MVTDHSHYYSLLLSNSITLHELVHEGISWLRRATLQVDDAELSHTNFTSPWKLAEEAEFLKKNLMLPLSRA
jgi:hypothetical protein